MCKIFVSMILWSILIDIPWHILSIKIFAQLGTKLTKLILNYYRLTKTMKCNPVPYHQLSISFSRYLHRLTTMFTLLSSILLTFSTYDKNAEFQKLNLTIDSLKLFFKPKRVSAGVNSFFLSISRIVCVYCSSYFHAIRNTTTAPAAR